MVADDFGPSGNTGIGSADTAKEKPGKGKKRPYLMVYETPPVVLLNAFGEAKYAKASDKDVWNGLAQEQKTGAMYATECASLDAERRGTGINRALHAIICFCEYQKEAKVKAQNEALMNTTKCSELYVEIDKVLPSLKYCLAPQKKKVKRGVAALRAGVSHEPDAKVYVVENELAKHAQTVYEWLDTDKVSRIRMLMHWHAAGGLSYVASVYHRTLQCFKYFGNSLYDGDTSDSITLKEFQESIKARHNCTVVSITETSDSQQVADDYA